ncbi:MAG: hypothetical protein HYY16_10875, partial [Planctomycetes bacterium]|nr:hypothetical protein [Planctomycetota bacterium]
TPPPARTLPLPGEPAWRSKVLEEQVAVLSATGDGPMIDALSQAAFSRLEEAGAAADAGLEEMARELVASYETLIGEGVSAAVLRARSDAPTRQSAEGVLRNHLARIDSLEESRLGKLLDAASAACKAALSGRRRPASLRKGKHEALPAVQEMTAVAAGKTLDQRMIAMIAMLDRRVDAIRVNLAQSEGIATAYDALLNRGIVPALQNAAGQGRDTAGPKAKLTRALDAHLRTLRDLQRRAPAAARQALEQALSAAKTGRSAAAALSDPSQPLDAPKKGKR